MVFAVVWFLLAAPASCSETSEHMATFETEMDNLSRLFRKFSANHPVYPLPHPDVRKVVSELVDSGSHYAHVERYLSKAAPAQLQSMLEKVQKKIAWKYLDRFYSRLRQVEALQETVEVLQQRLREQLGGLELARNNAIHRRDVRLANIGWMKEFAFQFGIHTGDFGPSLLVDQMVIRLEPLVVSGHADDPIVHETILSFKQWVSVELAPTIPNDDIVDAIMQTFHVLSARIERSLASKALTMHHERGKINHAQQEVRNQSYDHDIVVAQIKNAIATIERRYLADEIGTGRNSPPE